MNEIGYHHINPEPLLDAMDGDADACRHMFNTFAQSAPATYARLDQAIAVANLDAVRREAHSLKSSTALVGADTLTALLKNIELQTRSEPAQSGSVQRAELAQLFNAVLEEVRHFVDGADRL